MRNSFRFWVPHLIALSLFLVVSSVSTYAQPGLLEFGFGFGDPGESNFADGIAVDSQENIYIIGELVGTADLDPGPGTLILTPIGADDFFMASYDSNGALRWAFNLGAAGLDAKGRDVLVDSNDNVYITGSFQGIVDFDPSGAVNNLTAVGNDDVFVASYTSDGDFRWGFSLGSANSDSTSGFSIDSMDNLFINFRAEEVTIDVDPGLGTVNISFEDFGGVVASYDSDGNFRWVIQIDDDLDDSLRDLATDLDGNVLVVGLIADQVEFNPNGTSFELASNGNDNFVASYDNNGILRWAFLVGNVQLTNVVVDQNGNLYISGLLDDLTDLDPGPGTTTLDPADGDRLFVSYNQDGGFRWAFNTEFSINDLAIDDANNVLAGGSFEGPQDFDLTSGTFILSNPNPLNRNGFVASYNADGKLNLAFMLESDDSATVSGIVGIDYGKVAIVGSYEDDLDLNPGPGTELLLDNGFRRVYVAQYQLTPISFLTSPVNTRAAQSFNVPMWCGETKETFSMDGNDFTSLEAYATEVELVFPQKRILGIFPTPQATVNLVESFSVTEPSNFQTPGEMTIPVRAEIESGKTIRINCDDLKSLPTSLDDAGGIDQILKEIVGELDYYHGALTIETDSRDLKVFYTKIVRSSRCIDQGSGFECLESSLDRDRKEVQGISTSVTRSLNHQIIQPIADPVVPHLTQMAVRESLEIRSQKIWGGRQIEFRVDAQAVQNLNIEIFSLSGERVYANAAQGNALRWNMRSSSGRPVANGVYLYVVRATGAHGESVKTAVRKLVVLR